MAWRSVLGLIFQVESHCRAERQVVYVQNSTVDVLHVEPNFATTNGEAGSRAC